MTTSPAVLAAAEQVQAAWVNAGPVPMYHIAAQLRLMQEWPTLFHALCNMTDVLDREAA
jgi:hypothetical protein